MRPTRSECGRAYINSLDQAAPAIARARIGVGAGVVEGVGVGVAVEPWHLHAQSAVINLFQ